MELMLRAGDYYIPVQTEVIKNRMYFTFPFSRNLIDEIKCLQNRKWHPEIKKWSVPYPLSFRNQIALDYLNRDAPDPLERYSKPLEEFPCNREGILWDHQKGMLNHILTRRYSIVAAKMGTGKELTLIEFMEYCRDIEGISPEKMYYVTTGSGKMQFPEELRKFNSTLADEGLHIMTFERLRTIVDRWLDPDNETEIDVPQVLIGNESSKLKGATARRSKNFLSLADAVRTVHGDEGYVVELTGTPDPKSALDWWMQCEIAYPGYLKESHPNVLRNRIANIEYIDNPLGGPAYPSVINYWDDENRCAECGVFFEKGACGRGERCRYRKSTNQLLELHEILADGMVYFVDKSVLNLPPKHYKEIQCDPPEGLNNIIDEIMEYEDTPIAKTIRLAELSDGFQYISTPKETIECPYCNGTGEGDCDISEFEVPEVLDEYDEDPWEEDLPDNTCIYCSGDGTITIYERTFERYASPKMKVLEQLLEDHAGEDCGRIVIFAAFKASIDMIAELCKKKRFAPFIVDGRGWRAETSSGEPIAKEDMLRLFQDKDREIENIAWIGHAESSGTGVTLTESPTMVFYSCDNRGENREQAEDRIHRPGMDENKGATIIDLYNLPVDRLIRKNLNNKKFWSSLTHGQLEEAVRIKEEMNV